MSFDFALIVDSIPKMLMGIGLTFQLLFLSGVLVWRSPLSCC